MREDVLVVEGAEHHAPGLADGGQQARVAAEVEGGEQPADDADGELEEGDGGVAGEGEVRVDPGDGLVELLPQAHQPERVQRVDEREADVAPVVAVRLGQRPQLVVPEGVLPVRPPEVPHALLHLLRAGVEQPRPLLAQRRRELVAVGALSQLGEVGRLEEVLQLGRRGALLDGLRGRREPRDGGDDVLVVGEGAGGRSRGRSGSGSGGDFSATLGVREAVRGDGERRDGGGGAEEQRGAAREEEEGERGRRGEQRAEGRKRGRGGKVGAKKAVGVHGDGGGVELRVSQTAGRTSTGPISPAKRSWPSAVLPRCRGCWL